jgi:hypothetical protein
MAADTERRLRELNRQLRLLKALGPSEKNKPLRDALEEVAKAGEHPSPRAAANWVLRRILRRIDNVRTNKYRDWRYQRETIDPYVAELKPGTEWAEHLVKAEMARRDPSFSGELGHVGRRAVELVKGARKGPGWKKHALEAKAANIANSIEAEWFRPREAGRPSGAIINTHFPESPILNEHREPWLDADDKPLKEVKRRDIRLTHEETVEAVLPSILNLGPRERKLNDQIKAALAAVIQKLNQGMQQSVRRKDTDASENSIEIVAATFVRRQGPPIRPVAESDQQERQYLDLLALQPPLPIEIVKKMIANIRQ